MADSNWSMSSSSEDDEEADIFQSKIREDSEYYQKFRIGDYGNDDWDTHIPRFINLGSNNNNETMANALHLTCSVPDRIMVLNRDTNQYEVMRYIEMENGAVITPEAETNLPDSTMNGTMGSTSISECMVTLNGTQQVKTVKTPIPKPKDIPLEPVDLVDLIDKAKDRRKKKPDPEDLMELPMPSFYSNIEWTGKEWVRAMKPKPDKRHGFMPSISFQRERLNRVNHHQQRHDPRLQNNLFSSPKRVEAQTSKDDKRCTATASTKNNIKDIFGSEHELSTADSRSSSMSPAFKAFDSGSDFAAERNSTALPGNGSNSDTTSSDISLSDSDTFEEKAKRKSRSRRKDKKQKDKVKDKENERVPPLVIKLPKHFNSIDLGHSSKKQPNQKHSTSIIPPKLLIKPPVGIHEFKNDVLAAMQGEFPDDTDLTYKEDKATAEKCEEAVPTQVSQSINQTINTTAGNESVGMDVDGDAVAEMSASTIDAIEQPAENEMETKGASHGLDEISDSEMMDDQIGMVSHGNLSDLEDVSMEESENSPANDTADNLHDISVVDDRLLAEAVKVVLGGQGDVAQPNTAGTSEIFKEIEKDLALLDNDESEMDRFVEGDDNEENVATPNPHDRHELIKILDPNSSEEQDVNAIGPAESGPENVQTEQEAVNFDVPEIGATADVGSTIDIQMDQLNLGELNSFGRQRNLLPDSDETHRLTITINLFEYEIAENEQEKLFCDDDNDEKHDGPVEESCDEVNLKLETTVNKNENNETQGDSNLIETSEDDQEYDHPIASDNYVVPNSNTDRRVTQTNLKCTICPYKDLVGWKMLTKHYIRKHPGKEIAHSRLAERFKLDDIIACPVSSTLTESDRFRFKSICLFCDQWYYLDSSKWEKHMVSHTGECPFECRKCGSKLFEDLHKRCNSRNNIPINGPHEFKENKLYGYVCKLCSFVQLDKKNIYNHIENQHQVMPIEESIAEIFLINVTETASKPSDTDMSIQVDSDDEDVKPLVKLIKKPTLEMLNECVDLTLTDSEPDVD